MISFGEFNPTGTYVGVKLTDQSLDYIDALKSIIGLSNPLARDKQHITLCYSRKQIVVIPKNYTVQIFPKRIESWKNDSGGYYIVMIFECDFLRDRHESFMCQGGTHDYPEFNIHTTLSYNEPRKIDLDVSELGKEFYVSNEYVQELDLNWSK